MKNVKIHRSKIDYWLLGLVLVSLIIPTVITFQEKQWVLGSIMFGTLLFVIHLFSTTYYQILEETLIVKAGFLVNKKVEIAKIRKAQNSRSILSSPALSLDRIELFYGKFDSILVSPKDKGDFIKDLLAVNKKIEVHV